MIHITRSLARQLRAVFRRAGIGRLSGGFQSKLLFAMTLRDLRIRAMSAELALEYRLPAEGIPEQLVVPLEFLADCEGRGNESVTLETGRRGGTVASWSDHDVPQLTEYPAEDPKGLPAFPEVPEAFVSNAANLLESLKEASATADPDSYNFTYLQLRGSQGKVVATDGNQVLVQNGFQFPWTEDVLVPASNLFSSRELPQDEPVAVGKAGDWITLGLGPWVIWLAVNKEFTFPKVENFMSSPVAARSRLLLGETDCQFLAEKLPLLPSSDCMTGQITLDLNDRVIVRSRPEGILTPTELVLRASWMEGKPLTVSMNRKFLDRAVKLGFREVCLYGIEEPVLCDDGRRTYAWALLEQRAAIKSHPEAVRIESKPPTTGDVGPRPRPKGKRTHKSPGGHSATTVMPQPAPQSENGQTEISSGTMTPSLQSDNPIVQAEALRDSLREVLTKSSDLISWLKRQKKQSQLVRATLASLKELQAIG